MASIFLSFQVPIESHDFGHKKKGPLFHRWLPNGEIDAITLDTQVPHTTLNVWFDRRGYVRDGGIEFDSNRKEVDESIMKRQGVLGASRLFGSLKIDCITDNQLNALKQEKIESDEYQEIGKKFVKAVYEPVSEFIYLLKIRFGQYWLRDIKKWDSSKQDIGSYCRFFFIKWSEDEGQTWQDYEPKYELPTMKLTLSSINDFKSFITKNDWENFREILKKYQHHSIAEVTLARTHQYLDQNDLRHAIIEGATAVELATAEFYNMRLDKESKLKKELGGFWNLSSSSQLVAIGTAVEIPEKKLEETIEVIDMRHKVVHEGVEPENIIISKIYSLLHTVAILLDEPKFKFPSANSGNAWMTDEQWEKGHR